MAQRDAVGGDTKKYSRLKEKDIDQSNHEWHQRVKTDFIEKKLLFVDGQ